MPPLVFLPSLRVSASICSRTDWCSLLGSISQRLRLRLVTSPQSLCTLNNMAVRRKDSFLWGRAPPKSERKQGDNLKMHKCELLDDIQKLRLEINNVTPDAHNPEMRQKNLDAEKEQATTSCSLFSGGERRRRHRDLRLTAAPSSSAESRLEPSPLSGIQYLVENGLLEWQAQSVAAFLYKEDGLNKTAIGNFLGEREEMHLEVLKVFVGLHEFSDLNLVQALRQFLWSFRLPGEAQKIDRMMEAFATRYCDCNPGVFQSTDTCYILSFAIIMLNTSLHNPNVKDKPSQQRFVSMNRGINNGGDLPGELLTKLYASIRSEPFKIPEDDGNDLTLTFFNPDREGWLLKMGEATVSGTSGGVASWAWPVGPSPPGAWPFGRGLWGVASGGVASWAWPPGRGLLGLPHRPRGVASGGVASGALLPGNGLGGGVHLGVASRGVPPGAWPLGGVASGSWLPRAWPLGCGVASGAWRGRIKTWKRRWFILTDSCLYYFEFTTDKDPIGIIPLENLCVRKLQDSNKQFGLELFNPSGQKIKACKTEPRGRVVQGKHQSYRLSAASAEERDEWMDAIRASITKDPFYDLVSLRKRKVTSSSPTKG
ncbi:unnamed protein product [Menidia menidia]|uniref:(Atlantic silverside) hypothetical protein n=1 Tax=Menidia menidia TaxID=238744 RepID=A0A8S4B9N5_9TELE|nr:unnamed protein product [Menidia menidia]